MAVWAACVKTNLGVKISLRRTLEEIRGRHVVYCTAGSHAFLIFKSGHVNLTIFFSKYEKVGSI